MDYREVSHPEHADYPLVVVMKDGHVRGPFADVSEIEAWADGQQDDALSHPKVLVPADQEKYEAPAVPNEGAPVENASDGRFEEMAAEIERLQAQILKLQEA